MTSTSASTSSTPLATFFDSSPLRVSSVTDDFPLRADLDAVTTTTSRPRLTHIDTTSYPDVHTTKAHAPAFKRYRGTVVHPSTNATETKEVFFKLTGVLDPNALVCGRYNEDDEDNGDDSGSNKGVHVPLTDATQTDAFLDKAFDELMVDEAAAPATDTTTCTDIDLDALPTTDAQASGSDSAKQQPAPSLATFPTTGLSTIDLLDDLNATRKQDKLAFAQNTAYLDSVASCLTAKLVDDDVCPHFPRVYGVYNGVAAQHHVEFTEEYYDHRHNPEFKRGVQAGKWRMVPQPPLDSDSEESEENEENDAEAVACHDSLEEGEDAVADAAADAAATSTTGSAGSRTDSDKLSMYSNDSANPLLDSCDLTELALSDVETLPSATTTATHGDATDPPATSSHDTAPPTDLLTDATFVQDLMTIDEPLKRSLLEDHTDQPYYLQMHDVPVQVVAMEAFDQMLEDVIRADYRALRRCELLVAREKHPSARWCACHWLLRTRTARFERKWTAILAQVNMALVAMQHHYDMVHNDLHGQNILLARTTETHLRYVVDGTRYVIPTFGYIVKLIDMGRTTFQLNDTLYMGDVYHPKGEAGEQYTYIHHHDGLATDATMRREKANEMLLPNPAFDLARLACSLLDEFYQGANQHYGSFTSPDGVAIPAVADDTSEVARAYADHLFDSQPPTVSSFYNMLCEWITDGDRAPINRFDNFDLYKQIARRMRRTVPKHQLQRPHFAQFVCETETTDNDTVWYDLTARAPQYTTPLDNAVDRPAYRATMEYDGYNSDNGENDDEAFLGRGWGGLGDGGGGGLGGLGDLLRAGGENGNGDHSDGSDALAKLMSQLMGGGGDEHDDNESVDSDAASHDDNDTAKDNSDKRDRGGDATSEPPALDEEAMHKMMKGLFGALDGGNGDNAAADDDNEDTATDGGDASSPELDPTAMNQMMEGLLGMLGGGGDASSDDTANVPDVAQMQAQMQAMMGLFGGVAGENDDTDANAELTEAKVHEVTTGLEAALQGLTRQMPPP